MPHRNPPPLLPRASDPEALRALSEHELPQLACELREFLIKTVSQTGGHLSAGLGTVELTIALHYVLNTPDDRLVWDVGHQTYPHKILTGRRERMGTLRQKDGLAGFPKREESVYDTFGVGHASTSISAALGMAVAAAREGSDRQVVAVIGDGALSGGMAYEALNNAGNMDANLLVILNDNDMSISPNVGAMSNYLARILSGKVYTSMREGSRTVLSTLPPVWELAKRAEEHMKGMVMPSTLFEELGFSYYGPIDGHDLHTLIKTLRNVRDLKGPRFLHVVTRKGKGYEPAEGDPCVYHGVTPFDTVTGKMEKKSAGQSYTQVFGDWLCQAAETEPLLMAITPAMREGSGLVEFSKRFPDRYFDVGIAEPHALTFAAGLACEGFRPVVAIYSTFLQRAYDQVIHDICLQSLPVLFAVDRGGLVGADGPTHHGAFDLSYLRCLPNITLMTPADGDELRAMLSLGLTLTGPAAVRYPRAAAGARATTMTPVSPGKAEVRRKGRGIAILAFGPLVDTAQEVGESLDATVVNMRFVKPLDTALVEELARSHDLLVTVEENAVAGGAGTAVNEALIAAGLPPARLNLGIPDRFIEHGERSEQLADCGLDAESLRRAILRAAPPRVAPVSGNA
jgi:1-deoxy-D-xylulose-5-phosphate synthase